MSNVAFKCDRCLEDRVASSTPTGFTAGVYRRGEWDEFLREGENQVCAYCMRQDPGYRARYLPAAYVSFAE